MESQRAGFVRRSPRRRYTLLQIVAGSPGHQRKPYLGMLTVGEGGSSSSLLSVSMRCEGGLMRRPLAERGRPSPSSSPCSKALLKIPVETHMHLHTIGLRIKMALTMAEHVAGLFTRRWNAMQVCCRHVKGIS